jgi:uncharacterized membrane protein YdjX (TVP38/TMEM64 family)
VTPNHVRLRTLLIVVVFLLLAWWGGHRLSPILLEFAAHVDQYGAIAPIAFVLVDAVAVVALIPGTILTLAGGAVFGLARGFVYSLAGAMLGSLTAFLLGRHVARRIVARGLETMPRFAAIDRAVCAQGRRIVFLLRLSPIAPFNFLNYALGLTTLSVSDFLLASLGMIPSTLVYSYAGKIAKEALAVAGKAQPPRQASYYAVLIAGLAATVAATTVVARAARRALRAV